MIGLYPEYSVVEMILSQQVSSNFTHGKSVILSKCLMISTFKKPKKIGFNYQAMIVSKYQSFVIE